MAHPHKDNIKVHLPNLGWLKGSETVSAWSKRRIYSFLGVKYAEAPIGELRYKKPVPVKPWSGVKDVTRHGSEFPGMRNFHKIPDKEKFNPMLEDCLSLCVYSTDLKASYPVMFFIHGGNFADGSAQQYPPNYLLEKDIVLIVPQYRIGPIGFLSTMTETIPGNAGVLDLICALEWVQENIVNFGGDPKVVTVFGQSAGAMLASVLTYSDLVRENLFSRVILQSGSIFCPACICVNPVDCTKDIAIRSGCSRDANVEEINDFLMKIDVKTLYKSFVTHRHLGISNGFNKIGGQRLTIGGPSNVLQDKPLNLVREGKGLKNLSLMAGVTKNDCSYILATVLDILRHLRGNLLDHKFNQFELINTINKVLATDEPSGMLSAYATMALFDVEALKSGNFYDMLDSISDHCGTLTVKGPCLRETQYHLQRSELQTFLYTFDYEGEHTRFNYGKDPTRYPFEHRAGHCDDLIYLFPWPEKVVKLNEDDTRIARIMVDLWTSFAATGVPMSPEIQYWPPMQHIAGPYLHIDKECSISDNFYDEMKVLSKKKKNLRREKNLCISKY